MKRILLAATALVFMSGFAWAQSSRGQSSEGNAQAGTNISTGGVSLPAPRVDIIPTAPGGFVGVLIESPPPTPEQNRPGISGPTGSALRPDLTGDMQATVGVQGGGGAAASSGSGRGRASSGLSGTDPAAGLGTRGGAVDEQRSATQQQLRATSGEGVTASEGQRPNRVLGDRLDARQNRLGSDASGSVSGNSSLRGAGASGSSGLGGSVGGAARSSGGGGARGGSSGGGGGGGGG
jgi:hypothetical protein